MSKAVVIGVDLMKFKVPNYALPKVSSLLPDGWYAP